ncbi:UvrB/UvrC motif-containing protein [Treponema sp. OMZ 788]|uniref:UvrB/UvrC motif-containing protein n=1 Tax=unclassified Treponema TaxID=2638727 RepID=UPI0020A3E833|nr:MULTISPECIES: UvrB/UvrC motif-containing protein [unclassified Treponema]UTC61780.1 UvrB/UvrC motif-containing protein [Treponema sp. OMZ 787]UTC65254.1 UvrB/UvrC motif-containing protein [Treponema sp. OMZ 788]
MICDMCKLNEASVSVEQVADGITKNIYLCPACSRRLGFGMFSETIDISITKLAGSNDINNTDYKTYDRCPICGSSFKDIESKQMIGCMECLSYFRSEIVEILRKNKKNLKCSCFESDNSSPKNLFENNNSEELLEELRKAVQIEDYERAAALRDEIKALEKKHDNKI